MIKRIIAGLLILIVLVGTVGVSYDSHYCGGKFIKSQISFVPSTLSCGMKMEAKIACDNHPVSISKVCCENERLSFEMNNDYVKYIAQPLVFIDNVKLPIAILEEYSYIEETKYEFLGYSPPPINRDIIILHESFLI